MEWSFGPVVKLFQVLVKCGVYGIIVNINLWQFVVVSESLHTWTLCVDVYVSAHLLVFVCKCTCLHTCWSLCMCGGGSVHLCVKARG